MSTDANAAPPVVPLTAADDDLAALAKGGRTNITGFILRLAARVPFLFVAGRLYGPDAVGRFALAVVVVELAALVATLGLKRGMAQALATTERPHPHVVWDGMAVAMLASTIAGAVLIALPRVMYPHGDITPIEHLLPCIIVASAWSDVALSALAFRHNIKASVTARAVVEPWTISIAALGFYFVDARNGLVLAYMLSMAAAMVASLVPLIRSYGLPHGWTPQVASVATLARRNAPLAGADAIEWATRNVDRFILGLLFPPAIVGIYYMAQQVASIPAKLKTSFDPILGPVIATSLARDDKAAIADQVRQVGFWIMGLQMCLALMGSIPGEGVMGLVGRQFVAGTAALAFLLWAEVFASTGAVCESALVYIARHRNLMISIGVLLFQIALSFGLVVAMRSFDWQHSVLSRLGDRDSVQGASVAIALLIALTVSSVIKSNFLGRLLNARVAGWRWSLLGAGLAATVVGVAFTSLPSDFEWLELSAGVPAIMVTYLFVLWKWGFRPEDRALVKKLPGAQPA
ncbi:MAG TPA: lipopolysaccharide biosynthesis protein [Sphingomonas sp.]